MKQFKIKPTIDTHANTDVIPPPKFTHMTLPFNYAYEQNPFVQAVKDPSGEEQVVNTTAPSLVGSFIAATDPTPSAPDRLPDLTDPLTAEVITAVEEAFEARPIWTRRSLLDHLGPRLKNWGPLKRFIGYAAYQFKGGPWRDALMPYGLDPRSDPKYRAYQTLSFKLPSIRGGDKGSWKSIRRARDAESYKYEEQNANSHIFDGQTYFSNGKVWQVCDITDPVLQQMFSAARVRPACDVESSGWFHQGLWGKAKAVMKCKLVAVLFNRTLPPHAFDHLLRPRRGAGRGGRDGDDAPAECAHFAWARRTWGSRLRGGQVYEGPEDKVDGAPEDGEEEVCLRAAYAAGAAVDESCRAGSCGGGAEEGRGFGKGGAA